MDQGATITSAEMADWHTVAASEKAASILHLTKGLKGVSHVVEIGAGTGAVLAELDRLGFAQRYWACEPERSMYDEIPPINRLVGKEQALFDGAFPGQSFDLAILSHVVEHLLTPSLLVHQALERARWVLVEVPIENNLTGAARAKVKELRGKSRLDNAAGHVQFFSRATARSLIESAGGTVEAERGYFPRGPYQHQAKKPYQKAVLAASRIGPLGRAYHEHFAMLATKRDLEDWRHHAYATPH